MQRSRASPGSAPGCTIPGRARHRTAAGSPDLPVYGDLLYQGELLERRLSPPPALGLEAGRNIAATLALAVAALHRAGIIHRDVEPDNVILESDRSLKLPGLENLPPDESTAPDPTWLHCSCAKPQQ